MRFGGVDRDVGFMAWTRKVDCADLVDIREYELVLVV